MLDENRQSSSCCSLLQQHVGTQITCHLTIPWTAAMQVVSHDVIEPLSQTRVIFQDPSETTPTVRPKLWADVQVPTRNSVT